MKGELRKAAEDKAAGIAAAKAEAEKELAVRVREIKALQKKCDAQKTELDMLKSKEYNAKQAADEVSRTQSQLPWTWPACCQHSPFTMLLTFNRGRCIRAHNM